ncbi:precorrin-3B synthase [Agrobacterium tumefaciens]|uniref:precorrin-3B synthase n=1 Tax=Agrobacterium tumefaciens TaxID=358 RepID=UPI00287D7436|nr:precorrin-3B synthase [Agrobacterium tumefaciens]MDS7598224.1 precorrin-3B synthase [Agrobacterium tumefaciens]
MRAARVDPVQPFSRRGLCPALSAPMQTGDGLLSRVAFTDDISPQDLIDLCELTTRHGNGLIDVTARGGLQFRGLTAASACVLENDVMALGLPVREGLAVESSPLGGRDALEVADPVPLVSLIRERSSALRLHGRVAAKMSVIVDGGGHVGMGDLLADIRLKAERIDGQIFWHLMLGGSEGKALRVGRLLPEHAVDAAIALLSHLAAGGTLARGRDLDGNTVRSICGDVLLEPSIDAPSGAPQSPYGLMDVGGDRFAVGVAPAFGQLAADSLSAFCRYASIAGISAIRPGPAHGLFFFGDREQCEALMAHAEVSGFIVSDNDPRSSIAVCSGSPACASAFIPTHELAAFAARECASLLDGSLTLHLSGCGKGCAHPAASLLAFSGSPEGLSFSLSGRVSDAPDVVLPLHDLQAALSRLARLYEKEHKPGENARSLFVRLGREKVGAALRQDDR